MVAQSGRFVGQLVGVDGVHPPDKYVVVTGLHTLVYVALQRRERAWDEGHTGYSVVDGQIGEAVLHPTGETHG